MQRQNGIVTLLQGPSDLSKENGALAARVFINQAAIDGTREMLIQVPRSNPKVTMAVETTLEVAWCQMVSLDLERPLLPCSMLGLL